MQALLYYDPMGGENMPALSALLNYIGTYHDEHCAHFGKINLVLVTW